MSFEQKDNSAAIFRNDKGDNPKRPDYTGNGMVNGEAVRISAWIKEGRNGKFLSLSFDKPKQKEAPKEKIPTQRHVDDFDDAVPFAWAYAAPLAGLLAAAVYAKDLMV